MLHVESIQYNFYELPVAWQLNMLEVILNLSILIWFLHLNKKIGGCRDEIKQ
jgi:hypothetical protein